MNSLVTRAAGWSWRPLGLGAAAIAVLLFAYSPSSSSFFPRCPVFFLTGFRCTGCGSQRALHALAHLHIGEAWSYNPLVVAALPYLLLGWVSESRARVSRPWARFRKTVYGLVAIWAIVAVVVVFTVARNLP